MDELTLKGITQVIIMCRCVSVFIPFPSLYTIFKIIFNIFIGFLA